MTGYLIPLLADHVCLAYTWRSTIHASADRPSAVAKQTRGPGLGARTACGIDAPPIAHRVAGQDYVIMAEWPPPAHAKEADRCPDCATRVGATRVAHHWKALVNP
jgi:hypothetical protein